VAAVDKEEQQVKRTFACITAGAAVLSGSLALAQPTPPAPITPRPAPQTAQLGFLAGTWSCIGAQPSSVFGPAHEVQALAVGTFDLDGHWLTMRVTELRTGDNEQPGAWVYNFGYDSVGKQYVANWVDNFGGWGVQNAPAVQNNTLVLTGTYNVDGQKIPARDTFERANATTMVHTSEMQAGGNWITVVSETCHK
jgi:hypothetical protein